MYKEALTKHNFALSDDELATVRFVAEENHHRSLSSAMREIVRDYQNSHQKAFLTWKLRTGASVSTDDEVDTMIGLLDQETDQ